MNRIPDSTNILRHPGWSETADPNNCNTGYNIFFSENTLNYIRRQLYKLLSNVTIRPISVTDRVIRNVMETIYVNNTPQAIGDIYSRYHISGEDIDCKRTFDINKMVQEVIEIIYNYIKNEYEMSECNKNMNIWNSVYGTFNEHGLLAHPPIKLLEKRPIPMQFAMRY